MDGFFREWWDSGREYPDEFASLVQQYADAVRMIEREECAKVCEAEEKRIDALGDKIIADEGDNSLYLAGQGVAAGKCARLIRARSNAQVTGAAASSPRPVD